MRASCVQHQHMCDNSGGVAGAGMTESDGWERAKT
jgi:hypothetical protein